MALTRPTLVNIPAFDANNKQSFTFTVYGGGPQIVANKLIIRKQQDNTIVYEEKQETFKYEHTVNANILKNGTYYNAILTVFDANGNESAQSVPIAFWCYTTPVIRFTNIPLNGLIPNASFNFQFVYEQAEGEKINTYIVNLYNSFQTLLSSSGEQFTDNGTPPYNGNYLFSGFEDSTTYYVEIVGTTINNTIISTGLVEITIRYEQPDIFTLIELVNNCEEGYITLRSNIILIEGESNPDPPKYINNEEVDLTEDGNWVKWENGYSISNNFLARAWFRKPNANKEIIRFSNTSGQTISIRFMEGYENVDAQEMTVYAEALVESLTDMPYYIYSTYMNELQETEYYNLWFTRKDNIYQIQMVKV